jgi:ribosome biogenesis protein BMS1
MSDIVFCRCWVPINPKEFYNPVTSLLFDEAIGDSWYSSDAAMRPVGKIRFEEGLRAPLLQDSLYQKEEERQTKMRQSRKFGSLKIPAKLQSSLPHKSKPKPIPSSTNHKQRSSKGKFLKTESVKAVTSTVLEAGEKKKNYSDAEIEHNSSRQDEKEEEEASRKKNRESKTRSAS